MKVCYGYRNLAGKFKNPVVAIGVFDGVHKGHRRVLKKLVEVKGSGKEKVVVTFDPHPQTVLKTGRGVPRIMTLEHRMAIIEKLGIDAVVVIRFTDFVASLSPEEFVKRIIMTIGAKEIFVGKNFYFGKKKSGNSNKLKKICKKNEIKVRTVSSVRKVGKVVSSTLIRKLISKGDLRGAEMLLMRPVSVYGTVIRGDARGQAFGVPTANLDPHHEVAPPSGVYAIKAEIDKKFYDGVLNIGFRPTFYGSKLSKREEPLIEVHLLDFKKDLYGQNVEVYFIKKLRNEKKFKEESLLVAQIKKDIQRAEKILKNKKALQKIVFHRVK